MLSLKNADLSSNNGVVGRADASPAEGLGCQVFGLRALPLQEVP